MCIILLLDGPLNYTCVHCTVVCFVDRFDVVGYGCMTCIGNSGPLPQAVVEAIDKVLNERIYVRLYSTM